MYECKNCDTSKNLIYNNIVKKKKKSFKRKRIKAPQEDGHEPKKRWAKKIIRERKKEEIPLLCQKWNVNTMSREIIYLWVPDLFKM